MGLVQRQYLVTADQYVENVLQKYSGNRSAAERAANGIAPSIQRWAGQQLSSLDYSGSFAKGTANSLSTDVDLFISLKPSTTQTLKQVYDSLFGLARDNGWNPRKQNVSIGAEYSGMKIDLVPGKIQSGYRNVHSLYKRKTDSWTQTNVKLHIDTVAGSGRTKEIRAIKIWRNLNNISFPSFYLELMVMDALKGKSTNNLALNVIHGLNYIGVVLQSKRIIDPANTNNVISEDLSSSEKRGIAQQAKISAGKQYWEDIIW